MLVPAAAGVGRAAVGVQAQSEEMLPQMINTKHFYCMKCAFYIQVFVAPGFLPAWSQDESAAEVWVCGPHQEPPAQQLGEWEEPKERGSGGASLAERIAASAVCLGHSSGRIFHGKGLEPLEL